MNDKVETFDEMSWERTDCGPIYRHGAAIVECTNGDAWSGRYDVFGIIAGMRVLVASNLCESDAFDRVNEINKASA